MDKKLTDEAQAERDEFVVIFDNAGCTCFISPPCGWCVHPGNPHNQEDDEFWVDDDAAQTTLELLDALTEG